MTRQTPAILGNILSLYGVQAINILVPLATFPYLVRVIGFDGFGVLSYAFSWAQIGVLFVTLGFQYSATREVASDRDNVARVSEIFSIVTFWKFVVASAASLVMVLVSYADPILNANRLVVFGSLPLLWGEAVFAVWLFLGLERMRWITLLNLFGRVLGAVGLFVFVRDADDVAVAALWQSVPSLIAGVFGAVLLARSGIRMTRFAFNDAWSALRDSVRAFSTSLPAHVYARGQFIVLGQYAPIAEMGYYSVGQRVTGLFSTLMSPVAEALFPRICRLAEAPSGEVSAFRALRHRMLIIGVFGGIFGSLALFLLSPILTRFISGVSDARSLEVMRYFSPVIAFIGVSVLMRPFVMAKQRYSAILKVTLLGAVLFSLLGIPLTRWMGATGMVITMVLVELVIMLGMIFIAGKRS